MFEVSQNCAYRVKKLHKGRDAKTEQGKNGQFRRKVPEKAQSAVKHSVSFHNSVILILCF